MPYHEIQKVHNKAWGEDEQIPTYPPVDGEDEKYERQYTLYEQAYTRLQAYLAVHHARLGFVFRPCVRHHGDYLRRYHLAKRVGRQYRKSRQFGRH